jgi:hypothetical protein
MWSIAVSEGFSRLEREKRGQSEWKKQTRRWKRIARTNYYDSTQSRSDANACRFGTPCLCVTDAIHFLALSSFPRLLLLLLQLSAILLSVLLDLLQWRRLTQKIKADPCFATSLPERNAFSRDLIK